jgi:hypothetical protein
VIGRERVAERNSSARGNESRNRARAAESTIEVRGERNRSAGGRIERDRSSSDRSQPAYRGGESRSESSTRSGTINRDRGGRSGSSDRNRGEVSRERSSRERSSSRSNGTWRNNDRNNDSRSRGSYGRGDSRSRGSYGDSRSRGTYRDSRYGNRSPFRHSGRVHRVYPYGGGYRVWLTGCQYPFFIPSSHYHRDRFRVGLTIALGGFYNSRGYYEYYDDYDRGYYDSRTSRGELRGVVESVDYRRETFVVRNDATGSFVTVVMRDRGRDPVRAGDYVELGGDWTRSGLFEAYRVDIVDYDRRR